MSNHASSATLQIYAARSFSQRLKGLLGTSHLPLGAALYIAPCASVHTCFMRYAIDIVFLDRNGCVLKIVPHLKPWRMAVCMGAGSVLELAAGGAQEHSIVKHADLSMATGGADCFSNLIKQQPELVRGGPVANVSATAPKRPI